MTETELIAAIPALAFQAALLFVRIGAAVMVMPGLGEMDIPAPVRLAIALAVTVVAFPVIGTSLPASPDTFIETTRLIAIESLIGLWLGWLSRAIVLAFAMAGQFIALMMGLAMAFMPDQMLGGQTAPTSRFLGLLAACLILASGLYTVPLRAVFESYQLLPAGSAWPAGDGAEVFVTALATSFDLALRLAAPFVVASVVFQFALGLLARFAPQIQIFIIATPGQVIGGLALMAILLPTLLDVWSGSVTEVFANLPGAK